MTKLIKGLGRFGEGFITPVSRLGHTIKSVRGDALKAVGQVTGNRNIQATGQSILDKAVKGQKATGIMASMKGQGIPYAAGRLAGAGTIGAGIWNVPGAAGQIMQLRALKNDPSYKEKLMPYVTRGAENRMLARQQETSVGEMLNPQAYADSIAELPEDVTQHGDPNKRNPYMFHASGIAGQGGNYMRETPPSNWDLLKTFGTGVLSPDVNSQAFRSYMPAGPINPATPIKSGAFILAPSMLKEAGNPIQAIGNLFSKGKSLFGSTLGRPIVQGSLTAGGLYAGGKGMADYQLKREAYKHGQGLGDKAVHDIATSGIIPLGAFNAQTVKQLNETINPYVKAFHDNVIKPPLRPSDPLQPKLNGVLPNDPINDPLISGYNYGYGNQ